MRLSASLVRLCAWVAVALVFAMRERAEGANPISFCKCHCGQNVTIIPISPIPEKDACNKCTKAFCTKLEPNLCEGAGTGETVSVACFQRDSYKDEAIVWIFLLVTAALLAWALFKPCLLRHYRNYRAPSNTYSTLPS